MTNERDGLKPETYDDVVLRADGDGKLQVYSSRFNSVLMTFARSMPEIQRRALFARLVSEAADQGSSADADTHRATDGAVVARMAQRFLSWRLPEDFNPDNGISFKPTFNDHMDPPMRCNPTGTNLFNARQAEAMVRHMLAGEA